MTTTTPAAGDEAREHDGSETTMAPDEAREQDGSPAIVAEAATESLISVPVGSEKCAVCGAALAPDQHYCVECGTRRGAPRFSANLPSARPAASAPAAPRRSLARPSSLLAIIAIATLLIAFGVGLLVGHDISSTTHVTLVGGAGSGSGGSGGSGSGSSASSGGSGGSAPSSGSQSHPPHVHISFH